MTATEDVQLSTEKSAILPEKGLQEGGNSSVISTSFNFINSIIGSGLVGMSFAIKEAGFGMGIILLALMAFLAEYTVMLVIKSGNLVGAKSYQGLVEATFGTCGFVIITVLQFTFPFITMVSYNIIFGDTITRIILGVTDIKEDSFFVSRQFAIFVATILITLPISLYREVGKLAKISLSSFLLVAFILVTITIRLGTFWDILETPQGSWIFLRPMNIPPAIGIMAHAYICHHNSFLLYVGMKEPNLSNWSKVSRLSFFLAFLTLVTVGTLGYSTFTENVQGDLLNNYCWSDQLMNVARLAFCITVMLTFPIECFVCREIVIEIAYKIGGFNHNNNEDSEKKTGLLLHMVATLGIIGSVFLISQLTDCLGFVLEINGIFGAVPLAYILPTACYCKVSGGPFFSKEKIGPLLVLLFGVSTMVLGIGLLISSSQASGCNQEIKWSYCYSRNVTNRHFESFAQI